MKRVFALTILLFSAHAAMAQDFFTAQKKYVNIPASQTKTSDGIASYINAHYHMDEDKISAIYSWITSNIKYDADSKHGKRPRSRIHLVVMGARGEGG